MRTASAEMLGKECREPFLLQVEKFEKKTEGKPYKRGGEKRPDKEGSSMILEKEGEFSGEE